MSRRTRQIVAALVVLGLITLGIGLYGVLTQGDTAAAPTEESLVPAFTPVPAPPISGKTLAGEPFDLADYVGKPVVVNFWASWCTTCKDEAAALGDAERKWRDKGVVFVGMDSSDKDVDAKKFELLYGMEYTSLIDRDGLQSPDWGVTGYPETFFIGKDGRIVSKYISAIDAVTLDQRIAEIL